MELSEYNKMADKIDDAKKRNAVHDLSVIAYSLLTQLATKKGEKMAESFNDTLKCAFEEASERDMSVGKAVQSLNCPKCKAPLYAVEREKDYTWNCSAVMECDYRRTEPKKIVK